MSYLARAHALQTKLETLLGFDADTEIQGGIDEAMSPPTVAVMLTEEAANLVVSRLETVELGAAVDQWLATKHDQLKRPCPQCDSDAKLLAALNKVLGRS